MRYIDLLLKVDGPTPTEAPQQLPAETRLQHLADLYKSEGWKMFREMAEQLLFQYEQQLVKGTGSAEGDSAARAAIHVVTGFLTWPEREANRIREWMQTVRSAKWGDNT